MDRQIVQDQHTPPNQQTTVNDQTAPGQQVNPEPQTILEQEPTSNPGTPRDQQIAPTPESNEEALRQQQRHLRFSYPSCDLSEASYHTEHTNFPGSRHSSLNTEPLTLDADQLHEAKDQAVDLLQTSNTEEALDIFTKETKSDEALSEETEAQALADQINTLVEKAQQVVEANEQQQSQSVNKTSAASTEEERKDPGNPAGSLEEDVKLKAE